MVESLMLIALGFLTATLFALVAIQFVWRRAVKVTTNRLEGELNADEARHAVDRLANVQVQLQDKQHEVRALTERNTAVEETLAHASSELQALREEIAALHEGHAAALAEAERHALNVAALQTRIDELEAAASAEVARQNGVAAQLQSLGEKAARLVHEMHGIFGDAAGAHALEAALAHPQPAAPAEQPTEHAPALLTPFPIEDDENAGGSEDDHRLAEIKASLSNFSEGMDHEAVAEEEESESGKPLPTERFLAERIRALEAGVAS